MFVLIYYVPEQSAGLFVRVCAYEVLCLRDSTHAKNKIVGSMIFVKCPGLKRNHVGLLPAAGLPSIHANLSPATMTPF